MWLLQGIARGPWLLGLDSLDELRGGVNERVERDGQVGLASCSKGVARGPERLVDLVASLRRDGRH